MPATRKFAASFLKLQERFLTLVEEGRKRSTIRYGVFLPEDTDLELRGPHQSINVRVDLVDYTKTFGSLTQDDAVTDGFASLGELRQELRLFYPDIANSDPVTILHFTPTSRISKTSAEAGESAPTVQATRVGRG